MPVNYPGRGRHFPVNYRREGNPEKALTDVRVGCGYYPMAADSVRLPDLRS